MLDDSSVVQYCKTQHAAFDPSLQEGPRILKAQRARPAGQGSPTFQVLLYLVSPELSA